jgi:hypothetical protein
MTEKVVGVGVNNLFKEAESGNFLTRHKPEVCTVDYW